jgi:hypothetical protein
MTRNGIRVVDLLDNFDNFANKFNILADNHMAAFPGLQVAFQLPFYEFKCFIIFGIIRAFTLSRLTRRRR